MALALVALAVASAAPARAQGSAEQEFSRLNADRAYRAGLQQYRAGNYEAAQRQFEKATALAPDVGTYRQSLLLTRQRIAITNANRKAVQDSVERTRRGFAEQEEEERARQAAPGFPGGASGPEPASAGTGGPTGNDPTIHDSGTGRAKVSGPDGPAPRIGRGARMDDDPLRPRVFDDGTLSPADGMRDATKDLGLGGGADPSGMPRDLPVAGATPSDLPIGRLPPDTLRGGPGTGRSEALALPPDNGDAAPVEEPSMFPFLDPPKDPVPAGTMPAPIRPRLDRPEGPQ